MSTKKEAARGTRNKQTRLNEVSVELAKAILARHDIATIRAKGLSNLDRWNANGVWCSAHDEWREILVNGSDEDLIHAMTSMDPRSVRLRCSPPYPGLLDEETRLQIFNNVLSRNIYEPLHNPPSC